jgi:hypothetical protein
MKETIKLLKSRTNDIMNYFMEKDIEPTMESYDDLYYVFYTDEVEIKVYVEDYTIDIYFYEGDDSGLYFCYGELDIDESIKKLDDFLLKIPYFKNLNREKVLNAILQD